MYDALRSVCEQNRELFRVKSAFCLICKPANPFALLFAKHAQQSSHFLPRDSQPERIASLFYASSTNVRTLFVRASGGNVATVAGNMCISSVCGFCGRKILCTTLFVRSADTNREQFRVKSALCLTCKPTNPFPRLFARYARRSYTAFFRATANRPV